MSKIALAIIVKGTPEEVTKLDKCLNSISPYVDDIFITLTGDKKNLSEIEKTCAKFKVNISYIQPQITITLDTVSWIKDNLGYDAHVKPGDKIFVFDEARNYNFSQVPKEYEWILWLDCDDIFRKGENLREVVRLAEEQKATAIYLEYFYQVETNEKDEITKVIVHTSRERLVLNNSSYYWKGTIHEVLLEDNSTFKVFAPDCDVVHLVSNQDQVNSNQRNIKSLEMAIYQTEGKDNRYIYYLAKSLFDLRQDETDIISKNLMFKYLLGENQSDYAEERTQAWRYISEIYRKHQEYGNAIGALMNGLIDYPQDVHLFIGLATTYTMKGEWKRALFWLNIAQAIPQSPTLLVKNPYDTTIRILEIKYNCFQNLQRLEELKEVTNQIRELLPGHPMFDSPLKDDSSPLLAIAD